MKNVLFPYKREREYRGDVAFTFGAGFGCGASKKISVGYKQSLQTQFKFTTQSSMKLSIPTAFEASGGTGYEESETISYEHTFTEEWSYASAKCEYCRPKMHFPEAYIWQGHRVFLGVRVPNTRVTRFNPGDAWELRAHCKVDLEACEGCTEQQEKTGPTGGICAGQGPDAVSSQMVRVLYLDRTTLRRDDKINFRTAEFKTYLIDLNRRPVLVNDPLATEQTLRQSLLISDEVDRTMGGFRLHEGDNFIFVATKPDSQPSLQFRQQSAEPVHPVVPIILEGHSETNVHQLHLPVQPGNDDEDVLYLDGRPIPSYIVQ